MAIAPVVIVPLLVIVVMPPPFCSASARPARPTDASLVPLIVPLLMTVAVLAPPLPITTPVDRFAVPLPNSSGSIWPLFVSLMSEPVSVIALPLPPGSTPTVAPAFTVTFRLLAPFA
ncbi:hypothetical protein D3C71_1107560 [compost metagenome]